MYKYVKRSLDILLSLVGMLVLFPFILVLVVAIKLDSQGPVLFKQTRIGIHKKTFQILKFRTMRIDTPKDTPTHLLENPEQWITKVGKFLRKTSLDELPQDRKSTRLNSSHQTISYAVFCLKKKKICLQPLK